MASSTDEGEKFEKPWSDISQHDAPQNETKRPSIVEDIVHKGSNQKSTFDADSDEASFYKPIDSFEGRHRWDPEFHRSGKEEKRVVRKVGPIHFLITPL